MSAPLPPLPLPAGLRARTVDNHNGLAMHLLEAGDPSRPCVLLLHGFPELAYSWRRVMPALAEAGYYAVAPDQRGYGRTAGWDPDYDGDVDSFRVLNLVRDTLGLVRALGLREVAAIVGHDFGAIVAPVCALLRPDVFRAMAIMSAPFAGVPPLPFGTANGAPAPAAAPDVHAALAALARPRKHYQWYYSTRAANADMWRCPQGVHDFLRAYFHHKSADWKANRPFRLAGWTAGELAKLPTYYVMDAGETMAQTVAKEMPTAAEIAACRWLPDDELAVYASEYSRTGFRGGLNWYRCRTEGRNRDLEVLAGKTVDVPSMFVAGASDWGIYQSPGAIEAMQEKACARMLGCHLLEGAGHWVQQERADEVSRLLVEFVQAAKVPG